MIEAEEAVELSIRTNDRQWISPDICIIGEDKIASDGSTPGGTAIRWLKHKFISYH